MKASALSESDAVETAARTPRKRAKAAFPTEVAQKPDLVETQATQPAAMPNKKPASKAKVAKTSAPPPPALQTAEPLPDQAAPTNQPAPKKVSARKAKAASQAQPEPILEPVPTPAVPAPIVSVSVSAAPKPMPAPAIGNAVDHSAPRKKAASKPSARSLANSWKTKPANELSDEEILAMPEAEYMNDVQLAFFRHKLVQMKADVLNNAGETTEHLREETIIVPDPTDRATIEEEHALELRTRDRERKLLKKIEQSIASIDTGSYGYCEETGEPIGVRRLLARPTASLSLEAQQRRELKQKMFGD